MHTQSYLFVVLVLLAYEFCCRSLFVDEFNSQNGWNEIEQNPLCHSPKTHSNYQTPRRESSWHVSDADCCQHYTPDWYQANCKSVKSNGQPLLLSDFRLVIAGEVCSLSIWSLEHLEVNLRKAKFCYGTKMGKQISFRKVSLKRFSMARLD